VIGYLKIAARFRLATSG